VKCYDLIVIGGGIVGAATAWKLSERFHGAAIALIEKESELGTHQSGHNSGVIHAGVYYEPGSLKADFCRRGLQATYSFCKRWRLPWEQCGKLLVATNDREYERMEALAKRCQVHGIEAQRLDGDELKKREPLVTGLAALFIRETGITDYRAIAARMGRCFVDSGGTILLNTAIRAIREHKDHVELVGTSRRFSARHLIVCGGLQADRLAKLMDLPIDFGIVPFRGEYYRLASSFNGRFNHLIYPIPDPELPFLGVHITKMVDGSVTVGPNAVLGFKREGYGKVNIDGVDIAEMFGFGGFWRAIYANFSTGLGEMRDSLYKPGYLRRARAYCPSLTIDDLRPYPAGIRAQAVDRRGKLVHDFLFARGDRSLHVCNAPSPAATSAIPIAEHLVEKAAQTFSLG
jgi:L-2-hydroxyglutarate oxidase